MDIVATPIHDIELITEAMRNPRVWPSISDDSSPAPELFIPTMDDSITYLGMFERGEFRGIFMLHPHNHICWEVHTCLLPSVWGRAHLFAAECIDWTFSETACQRLITNIPKGNVLARRLALSVGMREFGINPKSFLKNGIAIDQFMLGISKE